MFWNRNNHGCFVKYLNKYIYGKQLNKHILELQTGYYNTISWIFCVFSETHAESKTLAAKALCEALDKMTFDDLVRVDDQMRQTTSMEWSIDWKQFSLETFLTPKMSEQERRAVAVFASFNPNGFIRERAIRLMKDYPNTLSFALLRQNDWVLQVREASIETTDYRLNNLSKGKILFALPFADKLSRSGRLKNPNAEIKLIYSALTERINEDEFIEGLKSKNIRSRRICMDALFTAQTPRFDLAFQSLQSEADPFLRAGIFSRLVTAGLDMDAVVERFLKDRYPLNRILAFQFICDTDKEVALQAAIELLLDKSAMVRENSRCYLASQKIEFDYRTYYKSNLMKRPSPAILGIGETGKAEDAAEIEGYLKSPLVAVVHAAMISAMRLNGVKYAPTITEFLADERAGIVKTARNLILKKDSPNYARIMEIYKTSQYKNTKQKCFSILIMASKWQRLIYILNVLEIDSADIEEKAITALARWIMTYNSSFATASREQIREISESIIRLERKLPEKVQENLRFLLR